ncbi:MAG: T9SS type A sorting domain-containing protein [Bacteroidota bacterium]|nr:T9SS type A sorting domain-containing protein [Bacteroidota bacterium]
MKKILPFFLLMCLILGKANAQTYSPIALSGFNYDGIAEDTLAVNTTTGSIDLAGDVLYTANYATKVVTPYGLPNSGTFSSGTKSYQLQPYNINNILRINAGLTDSLMLTTPASYASLSLLGFATEGTDQLDVKLRFTNGDSTTYYTLVLPDWYFNPGPDVVLNNFDRTVRATDVPDNLAGDPSLYSVILDLSCADQKKQIQSIIIHNVGGASQFANIFGFSGSDTTVSIDYPASPYSPPGTATPTITGITNGTFSSTAGLTIDGPTGVVDLATSYNGNYTVKYNYTNGACTDSTTAPIQIAGALPVKLVYFNAVQQGSSALLQWATSEEINNSYFEVERSNDGITFSPIQKIDATNSNSNQLTKYSAIDYTPLPGNNFYRLEQVDIDGKVSYSSIVELSFSESTTLKVYPNPATQNKITVHYSLGSLKTIAVYSLENKLMLMHNLNNVSGYQQLDISTLAKGVYIIKLAGDKGNQSVMFTKQ